ncbi:MAG TPA: FtsW/RodA/SpoVE family cell cycle protein, partial [Allocoleopsis sp.]
TFIWLFIGLAVLFSASYPIGDADFKDGLYYVKRQILSILIGMIMFNIIVRYPLRNSLILARIFLIVCLCLLFLTLIPGLGKETNGATRWLGLGPFQIQPSELIKPFLVLQSSIIFGQWQKLSWKVKGTWLFIFCLVLIGILLQPNLSTTALCGMTLWLIALGAGIPYVLLLSTALGGVGLAVLSVSFREYQRKRILSFLDPWADRLGDGYQLTQSLLAIGTGGTFGVGYGMSQQKLFYLPIQYTDFIFAIFAEEFGLIGGVFLIGLIMAYGTMALLVSMKAKFMVHRLVAIGGMVLMVGQSLLNIGVATGALPTTGLPLPLFSYGSNSMIASLIMAGLLIRVARESSEAEVISLDQKRFQRT